MRQTSATRVEAMSVSCAAQIRAPLIASEPLRRYTSADRGIMLRDLGAALRPLYPNSGHWLARRLDDVEEGRAGCTLSRDLIGLRAATIETPKGSGELKLSTIWVAERARCRGLGTRLLDDCRGRWLASDLERVWVTAGGPAAAQVAKLVLSRGFRFATIERGRYGEGRDEQVFVWTPENDAEDRTVAGLQVRNRLTASIG
jgi:ribosomal protein S18 acetylase RimI-like enzyme